MAKGDAPANRLKPLLQGKTSLRRVSAIYGALVATTSALAVSTVPVSTTVYVGRHFEIRDHDAPIKYVFNGATRVASVTGSLSSNTRLQRLRVYAGWNLISLAVTADNLMAQWDRDLPDVVQSAYQWNPSTGDYSSLTAAQTVLAGAVVWIKAATNASLGILGAYTDPSGAHVKAGGDYVACTGLETWTPQLPDAGSGWAYLSDQGRWQDDFPGNLAFLTDLPLTITPGEAFYFQTDSAVDLTIPDSTLRIRYYHDDHLGSSTVVTDAIGQLVEETAFYPFGAARETYQPRKLSDPFQFTQKERDRESGLDYFEARYLGTYLAKFITPDPKYANPDALPSGDLGGLYASPQQMNLYAYVQNNPVKYTDPTGLGPMDSMIYYDERKAACEKMSEDERAASTDPACHESGGGGRFLQVVGGGIEAIVGEGLCDTGLGCLLGGPMMAHGVDNIQAGVRGERTFTAAHISPKVDFAMNLLPVVVGGVNALRSLTSLGAAGADAAPAITGTAASESGALRVGGVIRGPGAPAVTGPSAVGTTYGAIEVASTAPGTAVMASRIAQAGRVTAYTEYVTSQTAARSAEIISAIKNGQGAHRILTQIFDEANRLYPGVGLK